MCSSGTDALADVADIIRTIRTGPGEITTDTYLRADLNFSALDVVSLLGRLQGRYGDVFGARFFGMLMEDIIDALRVGDVVEHIEQLVDHGVAAEEPGNIPGAGPGQAIVISNGRSGSTMLSDLLAEQSETTVPQEFFSIVGSLHRSDEVVSGGDYWAMLSVPGENHQTMLRIGMDAELTLRAGQVVPPVASATLPSITADPDGLYDVLAQRVPDFPAAPVALHHERFLNLLCQLTGGKQWVERSGGSTLWTPQLLRLYPGAKIVYLTRNLEDTARSMSRYPYYQVDGVRLECIQRYGFDPFAVQPGDVVPEEAQRYLPDRLTESILREKGRDLRHFRWTCAYMTGIAEQALADSPPKHLHLIRYEDILRDPVTELERLGRFLEFDDWARWAERVAGRVTRSGAPCISSEPA